MTQTGSLSRMADFHEAFGVGGGGGADDFESGRVGEEVFRGVRVGGADIGAAVGRAADDEGAVDESAGHVAHAAGVVDDLVVGDVGETPEHEFHDGAQSHHGGPHPESDEAGFADRGVDDAFVAEAFPQALGDFVGAVVFGDFLAHEEDVFVALEFFGEGVVEGLAVGDDGHRERGKK